MATYTLSDSLLNNKSSISSASQNGKIGLDLPSTSLQEIFVVAYYKDGSDTTFDNYNSLISGPGSNGQYRIMGHSGTANWYSSSTNTLNNDGTFKNGATSSSNSALPMPATLLRFTSSAARNETRGILYNTLGTDRGWIGGVGEIIGLSTTSSISDRQKIEGYLAHKWGLSLANGHPYKVSPPLVWSSSLQSSQELVAVATNIDTGKEGFYGTTISGLTAGETYHYRIRSQGKLNPKGISGSNLNLWLDAEDSSTVSHSSNAVSQWTDKSGNGHHAKQPTSSRMPTYTLPDSLLNNKSSISSASQNGKIGLELPSTSLQEIFVVAYYKDGSDTTFDNYNTLISGPGAGGRYRIIGHSGTANWYSSSTTTLNNDGTFKNGATSSSNSALPMPATLLRFTSSTPRNENRAILYNADGNDRGWIGGVGEIIGLSATSSTSDRQKIEGYLAHKWGLALLDGHPYKLTAPASQTTWSAVQSFTTPTNVTAPVLGPLGTANVTTTTADLEATLSDNGNAATSLVFYWGDNDGGDNPSSWDSNFTVSNAQEGTLRKSLTGLTGGTTYYFRTYASNWKGNVWANTTRIFTTVTSTVRENPVRNSDLKGWWKLDGNLKDSSGNNHDGDADFLWKPTAVSNLKLWLDAADFSTTLANSSGNTQATNKVGRWLDKSGNSNDASQTTPDRRPNFTTSDSILNSRPSISSTSVNGKVGLSLPTINIQEIFIIAYYKDGTDSTFDGYSTLLTGPSAHGRYRIMGNQNVATWINGSNFNDGGSFKNGATSGVLKLCLCRQLFFDLPAPLLVMKIVLYCTMQLVTIEAGLEVLGKSSVFLQLLRQATATKSKATSPTNGGLHNNLPDSHPYKTSFSSLINNPFSTDVASGSGRSLDLSNGTFATVSTGGTEDVFDGDNNFSISMWMKGWPADVNQSILSKNLLPKPEGISAKLWLDASNTGSFVLAERNAGTSDATVSSTSSIWNSRNSVTKAFDNPSN